MSEETKKEERSRFAADSPDCFSFNKPEGPEKPEEKSKQDLEKKKANA